MRKKAVEPLGDSKADLDIVLEFSKYFEEKHELLFKDLKTPRDVFNEIKKVSKGQLCDYSEMSYEKIEQLGGIQWPCNEQAPEGTKRLYTPDMPCRTADGKASLLPVEWIPLSEMACKGLTTHTQHRTNRRAVSYTYQNRNHRHTRCLSP